LYETAKEVEAMKAEMEIKANQLKDLKERYALLQ